MAYQVDIQKVTDEPLALSSEELNQLVGLALANHIDSAELTLRFVKPEEMLELNATYRNIQKDTNVLAFPSSIPDHIDLEIPFLGDIIICPSVLESESTLLKKTIKEHWSLIVIHGVLHLLGYDHIKEKDAEIMQAIEIKLLEQLGYPNPYPLEGRDLE